MLCSNLNLWDFGTFYWADGSEYTGEFSDNNIHGKGIIDPFLDPQVETGGDSHFFEFPGP